MYFYEVQVADKTFKGQTALTYSSLEPLPIYSLVIVPVKQKVVLGFISASVKKPRFTTKPLQAIPYLPALPSQTAKLRDWIQDYYPAGSGEITQLILPAKPPHRHQNVDTLSQNKRVGLPPLTLEQKQILQHINSPGTYLLHGETGTGKTRIYIELARREMTSQRSSIILTPEIGLTPQLVEAFEASFGDDQVVLLHSQLTEKQRLANWLKVLEATSPLIIIGPRSALFAPIKNLGLIVLDESHESSYKQEQAPHYHASKIAATLATLHKATLVLGSATPSVTDYFLAEAKRKPILRMSAPAQQVNAEKPRITVVDLKDRSRFNRQPHLSNELLSAIQMSLQNGEQSLIFLNRRGTARVVLCQQCGWQATCRHCDLPLTYHGDNHILRCHSCSFSQAAITSCPSCGNTDVMLKSVGTKAIVDELIKSFPQARIQRFDTDNKKSERLEAHYQAVKTGEVDIVVGTQLVAKGLDLPNLSTVGVVVADTSLYLPDYTAQEKSYQLLRQVIGRVGRGHRRGTIVVQTYDPESTVIQDAVRGDWNDFYRRELAERKKYLFPPFCHTLKLTCRRASAKGAQETAEKLAETLTKNALSLTIEGPMPSYQQRVGGKYQWQLIVKATHRSSLLQVIKHLPANWNYDVDPLNLL